MVESQTKCRRKKADKFAVIHGDGRGKPIIYHLINAFVQIWHPLCANARTKIFSGVRSARVYLAGGLLPA